MTAGRQCTRKVCSMTAPATAAAGTLDAASAVVPRGDGHDALLHGLGEVGDVAPMHMPWLLRLAHVRSAILMPQRWLCQLYKHTSAVVCNAVQGLTKATPKMH